MSSLRNVHDLEIESQKVPKLEARINLLENAVSRKRSTCGSMWSKNYFTPTDRTNQARESNMKATHSQSQTATRKTSVRVCWTNLLRVSSSLSRTRFHFSSDQSLPHLSINWPSCWYHIYVPICHLSCVLLQTKCFRFGKRLAFACLVFYVLSNSLYFHI